MTDDEITGEPLGFPKQKGVAAAFFVAGLLFSGVLSYQYAITGTINEAFPGLAVVCFICSIFFTRYKGV